MILILIVDGDGVMGDEWMGDDDDLLLLRRVVCRSVGPFVIPVAGRGGRSRVQDDVPAVSRRGRESEPRVHRACRRGTWLAARWPGAFLRSARRTHAAPLKGGCAQSPIMPIPM